jgi:hypothetical protein
MSSDGVLWVKMPYGQVGTSQHFKDALQDFSSADGDNTLLCNVGFYQPVNMAP